MSLPKWPHARRIPLALEVLVLVTLLGAALFLRLWHLNDVPPGFHFDEAVDLKIGLDVSEGARPIYTTEGWGREGLYYYLVALVLQVIQYNPLALRVSAVICSLVLLTTAYLLGRIWHSRLAGVFTVAWLSFTFWPLSASRFGVRHESLAAMLGLAALTFWWAWNREKRRKWQFAVAGFLLGATMYTYQPARFVPFIFITFALYLLLIHQRSRRMGWRHWLVFFAAFLFTSLPLIIILSQNAGVEVEQRAFTIAPLTQLLQGNPDPILDNVVATLKVFTISGDPLESYNLPGRPIFVPTWIGLFFYGGLAIALWQWRKPAFAFTLLWLFFTVLPTVVTISAPNFNRMVAAQMPIMFLAALPMAALTESALGRRHRWRFALALLLLAITYSSVISATVRDYFGRWPEQHADAPIFNRNVAAVAHYLEHHPDRRPAVVSSQNIEDQDPYILSVSMDRDDFAVRWADSGQAVAMPAGADEVRLIVADHWLNEQLAAHTKMASEPVYRQPEFTVFSLLDGQWTVADQTPLGYIEPDLFPPTRANVEQLEWTYPYAFCDCQMGETDSKKLLLTGLSFEDVSTEDGDLNFFTTWQTAVDHNFTSLAIFAHFLAPDGEIVAQFDGLGYPPHTWQRGDRFIQTIPLTVDATVPAGEYWLQLGLYDRESGARWLLLNPEQAPIADRVVLGPLLLDDEKTLHPPDKQSQHELELLTADEGYYPGSIGGSRHGPPALYYPRRSTVAAHVKTPLYPRPPFPQPR